jgi:hypothetical protein
MYVSCTCQKHTSPRHPTPLLTHLCPHLAEDLDQEVAPDVGLGQALDVPDAAGLREEEVTQESITIDSMPRE